MKSLNRCCLLFVLTLFFAPACPWSTLAADVPAKKDAQTILNEMRLKKFTKELELTEDQQKKVQSIFDAEAQEIAKLGQDATLSITDRRAKTQKLQQETNAKIKPVLTPAQLEKFEKLLAKPAPKKK